MVTSIGSAFQPYPEICATETLAHVFSFLPPPSQAEAAATCRLFRDIAKIRLDRMHANEQEFQKYLAQQGTLTDEAVIEGLKRFPGLGRVILEVNSNQPCALTGRALEAIADHCPYLHTFRLETSNVKHFPLLTDQDLEQFARALSATLRHVTLGGCPGFTETGYRALATHCTDLRRVTIESKGGLSDDFVHTLLTRHRRLLALDLGGDNPHVTDQALISAANFGQNLKAFEMRMYHLPFSREAVRSVIEALDQLECLGIKGCRQSTHPLLSDISQRLPRLHYLCLGSCDYLSKRSIRLLAAHCPMLKDLLLYDCLSPDRVTELIETYRQEGLFSQLRYQRVKPPLLQTRKIGYSARLGDLCTAFTSHRNWPHWLRSAG